MHTSLALFTFKQKRLNSSGHFRKLNSRQKFLEIYPFCLDTLSKLVHTSVNFMWWAHGAHQITASGKITPRFVWFHPLQQQKVAIIIVMCCWLVLLIKFIYPSYDKGSNQSVPKCRDHQLWWHMGIPYLGFTFIIHMYSHIIFEAYLFPPKTLHVNQYERCIIIINVLIYFIQLRNMEHQYFKFFWKNGKRISSTQKTHELAWFPIKCLERHWPHIDFLVCSCNEFEYSHFFH